MIRVKIAGEEVLSNKDFTITEELLKTSSTILDNVYPKTWEETHDYVNNFYFPKDYSSCTIENVEPITPIIGTRVSGNNINLNYNNELSYDIEQLKGNTEQNGTPTPSSPVPVNNVTGRQEIDVVGKNLFDKSVSPSSQNGTTTTELDTGIRATVTATGQNKYTAINLPNPSYLLGKTLTISANISVSGTNNALIRFYWLNNNTLTSLISNSISTTGSGQIEIPSSFPSNTNGIAMVFSSNANSGSSVVGNYVDYTNLQLEIGNQATTYEPYTGKQYEINLGKNLFNKDNANTLMAYINGSGKITQDTELGVLYIPCKPNTKYALQKSLQNPTSNNRFRVGCCASKPAINTQLSKHNNLPNGTTETTMIFETDSTANYLVFNYAGGSTSSIAEVLENIQIEVGNQATSYSPYKTPIELCKIGDYQDYIYRDNGNWYLHKEIGKVVLDGSDDENWNRWSNQDTSKFSFATNILLNKIVKPKNDNTICNVYSNFYSAKAINDLVVRNITGIGIQQTTWIRIFNEQLQTSSVNDFKSWLSTHNTEVYYILATPTNTEITDTELINQIKDIKLYNGINNISTISPNANGELQIYYNYRDAGEDIELIFAGLVKNSGSISLRPTDPKYCSLQILDYKTLLSEGQTLDYVINNKTIKEAIQMVINSVTSYGFIEGNINIDAANDVIGAYSTLNKTPYDVFQYLADISQSKWFTRVIDEKTIAIDFYDPDKLPKANDIEYTEQYFKDNNIIDINYSFSGSDYRNKQTILSEKVYGNVAVNDIITCNGYEQTFTTSQIIGSVNSIKVNNVEKTFATNTEKSLGILADFYYSPNSNSFESEELYDAGDKIIISYMPIVKGRRVITNDNEISRITQQINRNGTISRYEERNDIVDGDELSKVAEAYIKYKGTAEIKLNVLTENKDLFNIGQQVYFDMPSVDGLATDYMVKKKDIEIIQTGDYKNVFYTYELTSNFNSETDINFFDNQRRKAEGNISGDQFITRNVDINNSTNIIFDNLQVIEVQTTDNNTLNCALNSPFIN